MDGRGRIEFFSKNLVRGLIWLAVLIAVYLLFQEYSTIDFESLLEPLNNDPFYVYLVFTISEVLVGIIPPELFMIWASQNGGLEHYIASTVLLATLSYAAGVLGYWVGRLFAGTMVYRRLSARFFREYIFTLRKYGGFLIVVAAMTPLPYSGIAMIVGATKYSFPKYLLISLTRFLRFGLYSYVVWFAV